MELDKERKESWIFAVWEGLYGFEHNAKYTTEECIANQWEEVQEAMEWIEQALLPSQFISEEKLAVMQRKDLLHQLYLLTNSGSEQLSPEECEQVADMILRRKGIMKEERTISFPDLFKGVHRAIDALESEEPDGIEVKDIIDVVESLVECAQILYDARNKLRKAKGLPHLNIEECTK